MRKLTERFLAWLAYELEIRAKDKYYRDHPELTKGE